MSRDASDWVHRHSKTTNIAQHVMLFLADKARCHHGKGYAYQVCWYSVKRIAEKTGWSESTVKRALNEVEALGEIRSAPYRLWTGNKHHAPNAYELISVPRGVCEDPRHDNGGSQTTVPGVSLNPGPGVSVTHEPVTREEPVRKPTTKRRTSKKTRGPSEPWVRVDPPEPAQGKIAKNNNRRIGQKISKTEDSASSQVFSKNRTEDSPRTSEARTEHEVWREQMLRDHAEERREKREQRDAIDKAILLREQKERERQDRFARQETGFQPSATYDRRKRKP